MKNYQAEIEAVGKEIQELDALSEEATKKLDEANRKYQAEREPIDKKWDAVIVPLTNIKNDIHNNKSELRKKLFTLKDEAAFELAMNVKEHTPVSIKPLFAKLMGYSLSDHNYREATVKEKKPLENGIRIYHFCIERNVNFYLAMSGLDIVGFNHRSIGRHRGDSTTPYSYIGDISKPMTKMVKSQFGSVYYPNITYTEWSKQLAELKPPFKVIELTEKNIAKIKADYIKNY